MATILTSFTVFVTWASSKLLNQTAFARHHSSLYQSVAFLSLELLPHSVLEFCFDLILSAQALAFAVVLQGFQLLEAPSQVLSAT